MFWLPHKGMGSKGMNKLKRFSWWVRFWIFKLPTESREDNMYVFFVWCEKAFSYETDNMCFLWIARKLSRISYKPDHRSNLLRKCFWWFWSSALNDLIVYFFKKKYLHTLPFSTQLVLFPLHRLFSSADTRCHTSRNLNRKLVLIS